MHVTAFCIFIQKGQKTSLYDDGFCLLVPYKSYQNYQLKINYWGGSVKLYEDVCSSGGKENGLEACGPSTPLFSLQLVKILL